ncbi:hypothetical protein [Desulfatiferula olefinivorans]
MNLKSRSTGESPNSVFFTSFVFERAKQFSTFFPGVRQTANVPFTRRAANNESHQKSEEGRLKIKV